MDAIEKELQVKNFIIKPIYDGKLIRFDRDGLNNAWFIGHEFLWNGSQVKVAIFGDWKTGEQFKIQTTGVLAAGEKTELDKWIKEARENERLAKESRWSEVAPQYEAEFQSFGTSGSTPYLERKGIPDLFGARVKSNPHGGPILIVPLRDIQGKFWNYQRIYAQKLEHGDKFFNKDGKIEGLFHTLSGDVGKAHTVYICEGFATAASVAMALCDLKPCVVCGFNAGNLDAVASSIRDAHPKIKIIVCADNDVFKQANTGLTKGRAAAKQAGGFLRYPRFKRPTEGFTDFNDLHLAEGLQTVKDQILMDEWAAFFNSVLGGVKKEFVTGKLFLNCEGTWRPALNFEHLLRHKAKREGLNKTELLEQLANHQNECKQRELLISEVAWDGVDHIAHALSFVKSKNFSHAELTELFKDWCVKMLGRMHDSTIQNRCLILKGGQGLGKDTFIRNMFSHMDRYLGKFTNSQFQEKDMWEQVATKAIIHIEEFEQTAKMSVGFLKNLISADKADFRPPYARDSDSFKCIASFISSANLDDLLRDTTGNRRFAIIDIDSIDWAYPKGMSGQCVAQMFQLWRDKWKPSLDLGALTTEKIEEFEPVDMESMAIEFWDMKMKVWAGSGKGPGKLTMQDVSADLELIVKDYGIPKKRFLSILNRLGAHKKGGGGIHYYGATGHWKRGGGESVGRGGNQGEVH